MVDWELEATEQCTPMNLTNSTKCRESAFLRERYEACGASHGSRAKPITMAMNPWTGRLRSASHFTVKNRVKDKVKVGTGSNYMKKTCCVSCFYILDSFLVSFMPRSALSLGHP